MLQAIQECDACHHHLGAILRTMEEGNCHHHRAMLRTMEDSACLHNLRAMEEGNCHLNSHLQHNFRAILRAIEEEDYLRGVLGTIEDMARHHHLRAIL